MALRLLHSHRLVVVGLSLGYGTWHPTGLHQPVVIGWSRCRLGLYQSQWIVGSCDQWEFPIFFSSQFYSTSPCTALTAGNFNSPAVRTVKKDCERVWMAPEVLTHWGLKKKWPPFCSQFWFALSCEKMCVYQDLIILKGASDHKRERERD